jgi:hypothetical protein
MDDALCVQRDLRYGDSDSHCMLTVESITILTMT